MSMQINNLLGYTEQKQYSMDSKTSLLYAVVKTVTGVVTPAFRPIVMFF